MRERLREVWPKDRIRRWNLIWWYASRAWTKWIAREFEACGRDSLFILPCSLHGPGGIAIGDRVQVGPYSRIGALNGAKITIGDGSEIVGGSSLFAQTEGIEIGRGVLMAWNVQIYDAQHNAVALDQPVRLQGLTGGAKVRICDGAWLGANVVVLQGVTIGRNTVIGANSVVTKDIPDYAIAVGIPAKVTKQRAPDDSRSLQD